MADPHASYINHIDDRLLSRSYINELQHCALGTQALLSREGCFQGLTWHVYEPVELYEESSPFHCSRPRLAKVFDCISVRLKVNPFLQNLQLFVAWK